MSSVPDDSHSQTEHVPGKAAVGVRPTVLAVDDEDSILKWLTKSLDMFGYKVLSATDAFGACAILQSTRVDALILDVRLIGYSGLEVLEFVRSTQGLDSLPAIVLTGVTPLTEEEEETIRRHRAYVFYKPERVDVIVATLARCLR